MSRKPKVRDFKLETGLSNKELAERLNIRVESVSRYSQGKSKPLPTIEAQIQKLRDVFPGNHHPDETK